MHPSDEPERAQAEAQVLAWACCGDAQAVAFIQDLAYVSQTLDDLVDGDRAVGPGEVVEAFRRALITLPANPFYRAHFAALHPLLNHFLHDWLDATALERGDAHEQSLAFVLRDSLIGIVLACAELAGGVAWRRAVSVPVRRFFHDESLEEYSHVLRRQSAPAEGDTGAAADGGAGGA